ncbi:MAG: hypothetical protein RIC95_05780 [Vicingaceae bacterium]
MKKVTPIVLTIGLLSIFFAIIQLARSDEMTSALYSFFVGFALIIGATIAKKKKVKK